MKNLFIATSVACLIGAATCHGLTGDSSLQLALRYIIDGILVVFWLKIALWYRLLVIQEKSLKKIVGPIQEKEDCLCREIDALLSSSNYVIKRNPEIFGK